MEENFTKNEIINAKLEGIKLCLHCMQHKKNIRHLIDELLRQKNEETNEDIINETVG